MQMSSAFFTYAAYIQVYLRLFFFMEASSLIPDESGSILIWVGIVFIIGYLRTKADERSWW